MKRLGYILFMFMFVANISCYAQYMTKRLEKIGNAIGLPIDSISFSGIESTYDSIFHYKNRPLKIKVNKYNEIYNIGYSVVNSTIINDKNRIYIDFIERYLLETDIIPHKKRELQYLKDQVLIEGDITNFLSIVPKSESISVTSTEGRRFCLDWEKDKSKLSFSFTPSYQLITGADVAELEDIFSRHFVRHCHMNEQKQDYVLLLTKYGYKTEKIHCTREDIFDFIEKDGCQMVFSPDDNGDDVLFGINKQLNYIHVITLKEEIAEAFVYIGIQIDPKYFLNQILNLR